MKTPLFKENLSYYQHIREQELFLLFMYLLSHLKSLISFALILLFKHTKFMSLNIHLWERTGIYQFEDNECPKIEDTYCCLQNFHLIDNCTNQLIDGVLASHCRLLQIQRM